MSRHSFLLQALDFPSTDTTEDAPPKKRRKRRSKFAPVREEILRRRSKGETLKEILKALTRNHPDVRLPRSSSQLSRFIRRCIGRGEMS
jgi:hypothetical protein